MAILTIVHGFSGVETNRSRKTFRMVCECGYRSAWHRFTTFETKRDQENIMEAELNAHIAVQNMRGISDFLN
jgi:hypothetical protein